MCIKAHYSYDGGDECVSVEDICEGIKHSDYDINVCDEYLKCIDLIDDTFAQRKL